MDFVNVSSGYDTSLNVGKSSFCKLLISVDQLEKLLDFCNGDLVAMKNVTGVACQVSEEGSFFPGTNERIISLTGPLLQICVAIQLIAEVFRICANMERPSLGSPDLALIGVKLIVPNSVVGMIMGKGGRDVRTLAIDNSVRVQISKRIPGVLERMVSVAGRADHVCKASFVLVETIQADHRTSEHANVLDYSHVSDNSNVSDDSSALGSPINPTDTLQLMTKHLNELVSQLSTFPTLLAGIRDA